MRQGEAHHRFIEGEEIHAQSYVLTNLLTRFYRIISAPDARFLASGVNQQAE